VPVERPVVAAPQGAPAAPANGAGNPSGRRDESSKRATAQAAAPAAAPAAPLAEATLSAESEAELEASRVRLAREAVRERQAEKLRLVTEILPVVDDLDRSIAAARQDARVTPALLEGFELVRTRLERVLEGYGLERIASVGERFDPAVHEAIALVQVDDAQLQGAVVDEIERGYRASDRVLRAARVRVGVVR
jgi:molecular chaperone GrpE